VEIALTQRELAVVAALLLTAPGARGQGATWESSIHEVQTTYKTLAAHGVRPALVYDAEGFADMLGGARRGATYLGNLNLQLTLDMEHLVGWRGATIFLYGLGIHGSQPSDFAGDAQGVSSIEASRKWTLEEAWIQQNLFGNRFSALIGRYDLASEFYHLHAADLFLNASFGIGPEFSQSGQGGPSVFPNTSVGARFELKPVAGVVLRGAVLDGVPVERPGWDIFAKGDGLLIVGEAAFLYRPPSDGQPRRLPHRFRLGRDAQLPPYEAKVAVGVWHYTASFPDLSRARTDGAPFTHLGSTGAYVIGDAIVYKDGGGRQLRAFGQLGVGDPRVNRFGLYIGAGVGLAGVIPGREKDEVGLGVATARNGSHFVEQQRNLGRRVDRAEVTLELAYLAPVTSWLTIQPDLQYVLRPNTDPRVQNALVGLIRVELAF
jgi:porin